MNTDSLTIAIRVDASPAIGFGHASRCLALAAALRRNGCRVVFLSRSGRDFLTPRATDLGCDAFDIGEAGHASEADDARESLDCLQTAAVRPEWIIVDAYGLGATWHEAVRATGRRLLCIDDLANRCLACDVLVDQNLVADTHGRYAGLLSSDCRTLLGPRYALLSEDYAALRASGTTPGLGPRRIVVSFGGADKVEATLATVLAIMRMNEANVIADVVISSRHPQQPIIASLTARDSRIRLINTVPTLAPVLAGATLAVGGAGVSSWERLCLGVPSIAIPIAENQLPIAKALAAENLAYVLDPASPLWTTDLEAALHSLLRGNHTLDIAKGMRLCDGLGAQRVALSLMHSAGSTLRTRPVAAKDRDLVLRWANDPDTRRASLSTRLILEQEHDGWFAKRIANSDDCVFVMVTSADGQPMGNVRLERNTTGQWSLSFVLAPEWRGLGLGKPIVAAGLAYFAKSIGRSRVGAVARQENLASQRILESLGFRQQPDLQSATAIEYYLDLGNTTRVAQDKPEKAA